MENTLIDRQYSTHKIIKWDTNKKFLIYPGYGPQSISTKFQSPSIDMDSGIDFSGSPGEQMRHKNMFTNAVSDSIHKLLMQSIGDLQPILKGI